MDSQELISLLKDTDLWPEEESVQSEITQLEKTHADARQLGKELLQRDVITPYQANQLLTGNGQSLVNGPYRVLERIAEGGMGVVFQARHFRIHRIVALKVIRRERITNRKAIDRFLREVRASAKVSHPNIVRAYDADQVGEDYYFAMEFLDGEDLSKMIKREGALKQEQITDYIFQAALGLQHIHENDMVHRDIKPGNLMVVKKTDTQPTNNALLGGPWGQIKLLDMGLARLIVDPDASPEATLTQLGTVLGTADYMSPEQALHSRKVDIRSDIYSLGCTYYYGLTGCVPYPGGGPVEKILKHQLDTPTPIDKFRDDVPKPLLFILDKMMGKKREDRFQTPQELVEALRMAMDERPVQAIPISEE